MLSADPPVLGHRLRPAPGAWIVLSPAPTLLDSLADLSTGQAARQARTLRAAELGRSLLVEQADARQAAQKAAEAARVAAAAALEAAGAAGTSAAAAAGLDQPATDALAVESGGDAPAIEAALEAAQRAADDATLEAAEAALAARNADAAARAAVNAVTVFAPDPCARHRRATPF